MTISVMLTMPMGRAQRRDTRARCEKRCSLVRAMALMPAMMRQMDALRLPFRYDACARSPPTLRSDCSPNLFSSAPGSTPKP
jgi:hypothetical protein